MKLFEIFNEYRTLEKEDLILDLEVSTPKRSKFQWGLFIIVTFWVLANFFLLIRYQAHASGALITTSQSDIIPQTSFMDNCWKYLLVTNVIGFLFLYLYRTISFAKEVLPNKKMQ